MKSSVVLWILLIFWCIMTPILTGLIIWHMIVVSPRETQAVLVRQSELMEDNRVILTNQLSICKALGIEDCEHRITTKLNQRSPLPATQGSGYTQ